VTDKYEFISQVGFGGFSDVFHVRHKATMQNLAIKAVQKVIL
jgi:serine/threonine protein kinase